MTDMRDVTCRTLLYELYADIPFPKAVDNINELLRRILLELKMNPKLGHYKDQEGFK